MPRRRSSSSSGRRRSDRASTPGALREPRPAIVPLGPLEGPTFFYNATARDVMTRVVRTIPPKATLLDALEVMKRHDVSGLPVVDAGGAVVGILSERDIGRAAVRRSEVERVEGGLELLLAYLLRQPEATMKRLREILGGLPVERVMTRRVRSVAPEATLESVVREMVRHRIHRLPVFDEGRLVGIVTRDDVLARGALRYPDGPVEAPEFAPEASTRAARRTV